MVCRVILPISTCVFFYTFLIRFRNATARLSESINLVGKHPLFMWNYPDQIYTQQSFKMFWQIHRFGKLYLIVSIWFSFT
jgi:hypothetical protein